MLTRSQFAECVGSRFRIVTADTPGAAALDVELTEASTLGTARPATAGAEVREPFSLIFHGPRGVYLPQRIYRVEHERMGAMDIFLVPLGPDEKGMRYQAIFT